MGGCLQETIAPGIRISDYGSISMKNTDLPFCQSVVNPLTGTLKPQSNGPLYSNTVIGTLAVGGWAVTFGTARRGLGRLRPRPVPSSLYQI